MGRRKQRLTQQERHAQLLALLRREGTVRIATLAKVFDVTTETARRDLDELAQGGALKRTYGGGASRSLIDEPGIGIRSRAHAAELALILCPGDYVPREGGTFGADTLEFIRRFKANKGFIGAGGVTSEGVTDADSLGCSVKRAMMDGSDRTILLLDSSKYDQVQFERVCALADIDELVCEKAPPKKLATGLKAAGVTVTLARR